VNNGLLGFPSSFSELCPMPLGLSSATGATVRVGAISPTSRLNSMPLGLTNNNPENSFVAIYYIPPNSSVNGAGSANFSANFAAFGNYINVDWGDGTSSHIGGGAQIGSYVHSYANAGFYILKATASILYNIGNTSSAFTRVVAVLSWPSAVENLNFMFRFSQNNIQLPTNLPSSTYNINGMFQLAPHFNNSSIINWNTSKISTVQSCFNGCVRFNQPLNWDTSSVGLFTQMFNNCISFNQDLSSWNFSNCNSLIGFMAGVTLNTAYYDALLILWDTYKTTWFAGGQNMNTNMGNSKYSAGAAATARASLVTKGWSITDGGPA